MVLQIFCGKISPNESEERNPMKKLTSLLLSLVLMVSVLACGASAKTSTKVRIAGLVSGFFFNVFHQMSGIILNYHTLSTNQNKRNG